MLPPRISSTALARRDWLAAAGLAVVTFAVFAPAISYSFINYDDPEYVTRNPFVVRGLSAEGMRWAFTTFDSANWHPLTWLSLQLDASLFGTWPQGFHLTNVLVHAANAALLFLALRQLTGAFGQSVLAAAMFAVHPLRVESVAWVAERKDVLCAFFGLTALWAYGWYAAAPSLRRYSLVVLALTLSLLSKPMLVTLPFLFVILDWWPLGRLRPDTLGALLVEKLPLLALVAGSCLATVAAQAAGGTVADLATFPLRIRLENAVVSYVAYMATMAWPANLAVFYPHSAYVYDGRGGLAVGEVAGAASLLIAVTVLATVLRRRAPYLLTGWLWYLGTLVPVIGLMQTGIQARADRYTYFPQIGLAVALCWGVSAAAGRWQRPALAAAVIALLALAVRTEYQLPSWYDSLSLWTRALEVARPSPEALCKLAEAYAHTAGHDDDARRLYEEALRLDPNSARAHNGWGNLLLRQGQVDSAAQHFEIACQLAPHVAGAHTNWGIALYRKNDLDAAAQQHQLAIQLAPGLAEAYGNLGQVELARGQPARAADCYRSELRLRPDDVRARANLGISLFKLGRSDEALVYLNDAIRRDPNFAVGHFYLALVMEARGDRLEAVRHFRLAAQLSPDLAKPVADQIRKRARGQDSATPMP
jgi:Tfp pilus assembly protein PilF